ncbi:transmembrane protein, putative [Medicago truncatula]|uniref:Transmembrane protein, putative n=1 Tax=Medicago truncatula TaxID=3880 RepID=A0A072TN31_MEDTR|nr:transmembrane protein, putative [Medicago truncatula]
MQRRSSDLRSCEERSVCMRKEEALDEEAGSDSAAAAANSTSPAMKLSISEVPMKKNVDVSITMLRPLILKTLAKEFCWKLAITIVDFRTMVNNDGVCGQPRSMFAQPADVGGVGDVHGGWASVVCSVLFSVAVMDIALPAVRPVQLPLCLEFCLAGISIVSVPIFVSNGAARVLFWLGGIFVRKDEFNTASNSDHCKSWCAIGSKHTE